MFSLQEACAAGRSERHATDGGTGIPTHDSRGSSVSPRSQTSQLPREPFPSHFLGILPGPDARDFTARWNSPLSVTRVSVQAESLSPRSPLSAGCVHRHRGGSRTFLVKGRLPEESAAQRKSQGAPSPGASPGAGEPLTWDVLCCTLCRLDKCYGERKEQFTQLGRKCLVGILLCL